MAEARDIAVNREFIVSGFLSGQAFRLAVRVDNAAVRLIRIGLRDFEQARALETELVTALNDLERSAKDVRKLVDKVNRRRREGVPSSGVKQTYMVRSLPSSQAFRCAVAIDQIQRDISMLGLASSNDVAKTANEAQATISEAITLADNIVQSVINKAGRRRPSQSQKGGGSKAKSKKPNTNPDQPTKAQDKSKATTAPSPTKEPKSKVEAGKSAGKSQKESVATGEKSEHAQTVG